MSSAETTSVVHTITHSSAETTAVSLGIERVHNMMPPLADEEWLNHSKSLDQFLPDPENLITSHPKVKQLLKRIACSNITN